MNHVLASAFGLMFLGLAEPKATGQSSPPFAWPMNFKPGVQPSSVVLADLSGDGVLDMAVTNKNSISGAASTVSLFLGKGTGVFEPAVAYDVGSRPTALAAGDFDGNTYPDLAVAHLSDGRVFILLGVGGGVFAAATMYTLGQFGSASTDVAAADVDGDGELDLVLKNTNFITVVHGLGDGSFGPPTSQLVGGGTYGNFGRLAVSDLSGDGKPDIALPSYNTASLVVLLNTGGGVWAPPANYPLGTGTAPLPTVRSADVSGDGKPDLVVVPQILFAGSSFVSVLLNAGGGAFNAPVNYPLSPSYNSSAVAIGDVNGDEKQDLILPTISIQKDIAVLMGLGGGSFGPATSYKITSFLAATGPTDIALGDLNGDGNLDVSVPLTGQVIAGDSVAVVLNHKGSPWLNLGSGSAGQTGVPLLTGSGSLAVGSAGTLTLTNARPSAVADLFVSFGSFPAPFKGGTFVPAPVNFELLTLADSTGMVSFVWASWPAGVPPLSTLYFQFAIQDRAATLGVALSNALQALTP